ncbi:transposase, partial [Trifolium pratense]
VVDNTITIASEVIHNTVPNASEINQNIADGTTIVEAQYDPNSEGGDMGNLETEMSDEDTTISEAEHDPNDEGVEEEYTETITTEGQSKKKRVFLSNINRDAISQVLINESHNGKLIRGTVARFDDDNNETFSGKIGMWPLVVEEPAIRSSVNRPAGTLVTKPITSITKEVSRNFLINKILPAIKEKWPRDSIRETIYIQQDNAPCHVPINDPLFCRAAAEGGFDIRLICQPPNSPDLNVLDLGLFSAIQSLQQTEVARSVNELIQVVQQAFDNYSSIDSNKVFLTLQASMIVIMKIKGSNQYKTPHMKKDVLINQGKLPCHLKCDLELVQQTCAYLDNVGQGINPSV